MKIRLIDLEEEEQQKQKPKYTSWDEFISTNSVPEDVKQEPPNDIIPSKVMVINNVSVTIDENLKGDFTFKVDSDFAKLQDNSMINIDITCKEAIAFDENITQEKLKSVIRRCGVLEKYKNYFTNDPDIIINSYTLIVKKEYQFFDEFKEGVLIAEEIFE